MHVSGRMIVGGYPFPRREEVLGRGMLWAGYVVRSGNMINSSSVKNLN